MKLAFNQRFKRPRKQPYSIPEVVDRSCNPAPWKLGIVDGLKLTTINFNGRMVQSLERVICNPLKPIGYIIIMGF